ncbi:hypothetical protein quinque_007153 [Culex quinquefasciatus]
MVRVYLPENAKTGSCTANGIHATLERSPAKQVGITLGSFLRKSTKKSDIFVFPDVSDERAFASQDVIITLKEPSVRRGRYSFEPNPLI